MHHPHFCTEVSIYHHWHLSRFYEQICQVLKYYRKQHSFQQFTGDFEAGKQVPALLIKPFVALYYFRRRSTPAQHFGCGPGRADCAAPARLGPYLSETLPGRPFQRPFQ